MGIYQKDLAKALGIHPSQISGRMRGRVAFTLDEIEILAGIFDIDPADLMPKADRSAIADRPASSALPRLDLNQQPFAYVSSQVSGGVVIPLFAPGDRRRSEEPRPATRPIRSRPFAPVRVCSRHLVAM
jgi:transcriptional regulator with XRE-family HTH domain